MQIRLGLKGDRERLSQSFSGLVDTRETAPHISTSLLREKNQTRITNECKKPIQKLYTLRAGHVKTARRRRRPNRRSYRQRLSETGNKLRDRNTHVSYGKKWVRTNVLNNFFFF